MSFSLFNLVPAVYRLRDGQIAATMQLLTPDEQSQLYALQNPASPLDAEQTALMNELAAKATRGPLESLLMVIDEQLGYFAADLDQLYDDQFIETCAPWVIPYIGELIGFEPIRGIAPAVDNPRSEVANTIALRRRKGTIGAIEQLSRDVTGWGAHAVEFFQTLAETQYVKCVRLNSYYAPNVRGWKPRAYASSGFTTMTRKVDVHLPASPGLPRWNIPNIGVYLWSLGAYSLTGVSAVQASDTSGPVTGCYRFSQLGCDIPLFHAAVYQGEQIMTLATEANVPDYLTRNLLCADLRKGAQSSYYGVGKSLSVTLNGQLLNPYQIQVADLDGDDGSWNNLLQSGSQYTVAIDPEKGRIAVSPDVSVPAGALVVDFYYGFNAAMGGGEYEREATFIVTNPANVFAFPDPTQSYNNDLQSALTFVAGQAATLGSVALEIQGSGPAATITSPLTIDAPQGVTIEIRAQDGASPYLVLDGAFEITGDKLSTVILNGLLLTASSKMNWGAGGSEALVLLPTSRPSGADNVVSLQVEHCTLVPGWRLSSAGEPQHADAPAILSHAIGAEISVELSITGPIRAPETVPVSMSDSILDATGRRRIAYDNLDGQVIGGGPLTLTGCTVVGRVHAQELVLVSDSIFWSEIIPGTPPAIAPGLFADRTQAGCVRFSYLPYQAVTPRRFECVEQVAAGPTPLFLSYRYTQPGYLKLAASTPSSIREGADDEGEMGAFHWLLAPLREADLEIRLEEFTPVGLNTGLIYQT
ncbi:MAG: hypothetical protein ABSD59_02940 [Terracidiphilus sp.]|jgi:hypothetical protein